MYKIYNITCLANGKVYIGQTRKEIEERLQQHKNNAKYKTFNTRFYNAINKYGEENFIVEQLDEAETYEEVIEKEIYWINYYKSNHYKYEGYGYNSTDGGEGLRGFSHSEKTKEKLKQINLGNKHTEEAKTKVSKSLIGNKRGSGYRHTEEAKRKISIASSKRNDFRHSEESKKKISEAGKGRPAWNKGIKISEMESLKNKIKNLQPRINSILELELIKKIVTENELKRLYSNINNDQFEKVIVFLMDKIKSYKSNPEEEVMKHKVRKRLNNIKTIIFKAKERGVLIDA